MKPNPNPNSNPNPNGREQTTQPLVQTTPSKKVTLQPKGGDEVRFASFEIIALDTQRNYKMT